MTIRQLFNDHRRSTSVVFVVLAAIAIASATVYASNRPEPSTHVEYSFPAHASVDDVLAVADTVVTVTVSADEGTFVEHSQGSSDKSGAETHAYRVVVDKVIRGDTTLTEAVFLQADFPEYGTRPLTPGQQLLLMVRSNAPGAHPWIEQYAEQWIFSEVGLSDSIFDVVDPGVVVPRGAGLRAIGSKPIAGTSRISIGDIVALSKVVAVRPPTKPLEEPLSPEAVAQLTS